MPPPLLDITKTRNVVIRPLHHTIICVAKNYAVIVTLQHFFSLRWVKNIQKESQIFKTTNETKQYEYAANLCSQQQIPKIRSKSM
jgi:hypothetical protein